MKNRLVLFCAFSLPLIGGCAPAKNRLTFVEQSNYLYTYSYGQPLNDLFQGDDAGFLYAVEGDSDIPMPVVEMEFDPDFYNHTQIVPVSVTSGSDSISRTIQMIILDQNPPEIIVELPEKPNNQLQVTDLVKVQDTVDWTGAVNEVPFISEYAPEKINYEQPGWYARSANKNPVIFPYAQDLGKNSELEIIAWDGHGNFAHKTIDVRNSLADFQDPVNSGQKAAQVLHGEVPADDPFSDLKSSDKILPLEDGGFLIGTGEAEIFSFDDLGNPIAGIDLDDNPNTITADQARSIFNQDE